MQDCVFIPQIHQSLVFTCIPQHKGVFVSDEFTVQQQPHKIAIQVRCRFQNSSVFAIIAVFSSNRVQAGRMEGIWREVYFVKFLIERSTMKRLDEKRLTWDGEKWSYLGSPITQAKEGTYWTWGINFNGAFKYRNGRQEFLQKTDEGGVFRCMYIDSGAVTVRNVGQGNWSITHETPYGVSREVSGLPEHRLLSLNVAINLRDQTGTLVFGTDCCSHDALWLVRVTGGGNIETFDLPAWIQGKANEISNISPDMKLAVTSHGTVLFKDAVVHQQQNVHTLKLCMVRDYYVIFTMTSTWPCPSSCIYATVVSASGEVLDVQAITQSNTTDVLSRVNQVSPSEMLVFESFDDKVVTYARVHIGVSGGISTDPERVKNDKDPNWQRRYAIGVFK